MHFRKLKQIIYGLIFILIIFSLIYFFYMSFGVRPSCFDGKKNQGEDGIDCGGPCQKICLSSNLRNVEINWVKFNIINNKLILLAQIKNPNNDFGIYNFDYKFNIFDKNKNLIKTINNNSFIYSEEIKYLIEFLDFYDIQNIDSVDLKILNPVWQKKDDFKRPILNVLDKNIYEKENNLNVFGKIINNDFVNFKNVNILVNFYNQGYWIGSSKTIINSIGPKEVKDFNVIFPKLKNISNIEDLQVEIVLEAKKT
ncbi:MAG: hypothetical protein NZ484_01660 [Patescibacteria group bacterium]|nr:hypothetical protein [Patescibacteria group bacterium]MCX7589764.1 hypothetical protein [Patescibacteria group bacterium]MDW8279721.1 hypothetical protein [bacterium]